MHYANWRRIFSIFLCFVLLVSIVPFRAHAVGVDWVASQVGIDIAVAGIMEGLGVFRDSASDYFGELITEVKSYLNTAGYAAGEVLDVYWKVDPLQQNPLLTIPLSVVLAVRNYIFDNGIVRNSSSFPDGVPSELSTVWENIQGYRHRFYGNSGSTFYVGYSTYSLWYENHYVGTSSPGTSSYLYYYQFDGAGVSQAILTNVLRLDSCQIFNDDSPYTTKNILLSYIAPSNTLFTSAYPLWLEHERYLINGSTEKVVQIGLGNTLEETESFTQEQIWSGLGSVQIPEQDQTQGTLLDILQTLVQLPTQIVGSIQTALQSFFQFSGQSSDYIVQLRDFFPFCIPFDLFDFITVLSAEPEAPVFHWEIPVPQLGQTFELEVDLSAWDDIAILFRNLELLAFIFGLAIMTREKFLRS